MRGMNLLFILSFLVVILSLHKQVLSFPEGPGWHACHDLTPNIVAHGLTQTSESPYELVLSSYSYTASTPKITATIQKKDSSTVGFKGFIVTAFDATGHSVGKFTGGSDSHPMCYYDSVIGHKNRNEKNSVDLEWTPPASPVGNITFKATILQSIRVYWHSVPSLTLIGPGTPVAEKVPPPVNTGNTIDPFDLSKCGKERGCIRFPSACTTDANCQAIATWKDAGDYIEFDISVNGSFKSVGVGFSKDNIMNDDSIFGCYIGNNFEKFGSDNYYAPKNPTNNIFAKMITKKPIPNAVILDEASFNAVEKLKCKIRRKKYVAGEEDEYFDIREQNSYYLMLSISDYSVNWPRYEGLYYHSFTKVITKSSVNMTTDNDIKLDIVIPAAPSALPSPQGELKLPAGCAKSECKGIVTWKEVGDEMEMVLKAGAGFGYVGFGLSHDASMHKDSMIICSKLNDPPKAVHYYSETAYALPNLIGEEGITLSESSSTDGVECKFKRKKKVANAKIFEISKDNYYHLFLAVGSIQNNVLQSHGPTNRMATDDKLSLLDTRDPPPKTTQLPTKPSTRQSNIDFEDCGVKKSCIRTPKNCNPESKCEFSATWKKVDNSYEFEISGSGHRYVAFGLSKDKKMGDDSVVVCTDVFEGQKVMNYYNEGNTPKAVQANDIETLKVKYENGIYCKFKRIIQSDNKQIFDMTDGLNYTILLAAGSANSARKSGSISYHGNNRIVAEEKIEMGKIVNIGGSKKDNNLMKVHGILMACAWIIFAVFGIFNARYFKTLYSKKIGDLDAWFVLHRIGMVMATIVTIVAFTIILYDLDGKIVENSNKLHNAHPIIGIVVLILVLINPIMAIFRPKPTASKRPIFNWAHRIVGLSALILGIINVVIGLRLDRVGLVENDLWVSWVTVGFFILAIFLGLILDFIPILASDEQIKKSNSYALEPMGSQSGSPKESHGFVKFIKTSFLIVILLASLTTTIIIIIKVVE